VIIKAVPLVSDAVLLLTVTALLSLGGAALVQIARRRREAVSKLACTAAAIFALYAGADVLAAGFTTSPERLHLGDFECFDGWCATMTGGANDVAAHTVLVDVGIENRTAGRAVRVDLYRAYLWSPEGGRVTPRQKGALTVLLRSSEVADVTLTFPTPPDIQDARLVIVGGSAGLVPSVFEIGSEDSPFRTPPFWPLSPFTAP
jgi:hypothetical protein